MNHYSAHIEVNRRELTADQADELLESLAEYHPSVGQSKRGWVDAQITLPADNLQQATATAIAIVSMATGAEAISAEVMTEVEFDSRQGYQPTPELIGVTEAAGILDKSRQRVLQMIDEGKLSGQKVGSSLVLVRSEVDAAAQRSVSE